MRPIHMLSLLLGLFLALGAGCSRPDVKAPKVNFQSIALRRSGLLEGTLDVKLSVDNPNAFAFDIDRVSYRLFLNDHQISTDDLTEPVHLEASKATEVVLPVRVRYPDLLATLSDALSSNKVRYRVEGEAKSGWVTAPFKREGEVQLKGIK